MRFELWAPVPDRVDLVLDGRDVELRRSDDGWWRGTVDEVATGARYGYRLDGSDEVLPDPRARRQPDGVHGLSATFDPTDFAWTDAAWTGRPLAGGLVYELHLGTFTPAGTLDAAAEKLDHLVDLGVTHVELLPVNAFNGTHNWGYDGVLWYSVQETYGGPAAYQRFVDAAHARGLAVVQDVVYNHLGPSGNRLPEFGPYLHADKGNTWGDAVNLDGPDSDEVRAYIIDNALMWLREYHVDGLRLDAVHALVDHSARHVLEELVERVEGLAGHERRPLTLIAESDLNDSRLIMARESGGIGLHAQWSDDFHHVVHVALTGEKDGYYADFGSMAAIGKVVTRGFFHDGTLSTFRGRRHGRPVDRERTPGSRFVVCLQDHDQIGNRAVGDRLSATLGPDQLAVAATLLFTAPFTPMLFMGEEWAAGTPWQFFTSHPEPELATATAEGRISEFARMGWDPESVPDPQDGQTFEQSKLDWTELDRPANAATLAVYRELARLRRTVPELTDPWLDQVHAESDEDTRTLTIHRGSVRVLINIGAADHAFAVPADAEILFSTTQARRDPAGALVVPAPGAVVARCTACA